MPPIECIELAADPRLAYLPLEPGLKTVSTSFSLKFLEVFLTLEMGILDHREKAILGRGCQRIVAALVKP